VSEDEHGLCKVMSFFFQKWWVVTLTHRGLTWGQVQAHVFPVSGESGRKSVHGKSPNNYVTTFFIITYTWHIHWYYEYCRFPF